jgi:hypothetical protein
MIFFQINLWPPLVEKRIYLQFHVFFLIIWSRHLSLSLSYFTNLFSHCLLWQSHFRHICTPPAPLKCPMTLEIEYFTWVYLFAIEVCWLAVFSPGREKLVYTRGGGFGLHCESRPTTILHQSDCLGCHSDQPSLPRTCPCSHVTHHRTNQNGGKPSTPLLPPPMRNVKFLNGESSRGGGCVDRVSAKRNHINIILQYTYRSHQRWLLFLRDTAKRILPDPPVYCSHWQITEHYLYSS